MLEESGDEDETNSIVNKVLDEIGIEISGKVMCSRYSGIAPLCCLVFNESIFCRTLADVRCSIGNQRQYWTLIEAIRERY